MNAGDKGSVLTFDSGGFDMSTPLAGTAIARVQRVNDIPASAHRDLTLTINIAPVTTPNADGVMTTYPPGFCAQRVTLATDFPTGGTYRMTLIWTATIGTQSFTGDMVTEEIGYQITP